jgi:O-glycosyl hydrolase
MKKLIFTFSAIMLGFFSFCQTGTIENFDDGNLVGWSGQPDYTLTNVGGELKISTNKTSTWNSFQYDFAPVDISANPFVSLKVKTDIDFNLNFSIWDNTPGDHNAYPVNDSYQTIVHSTGYATYTFDFRKITTVDLTKITRLNFVFNPSGAKGCNSTVYFDEIRIGDHALVMPAITKIPDQVHGINSATVKLPFWGIKDRETGSASLSVRTESSNTALIPNPTVIFTPGSAGGILEYTPVTDQAGSSVITVTVSGNATDDNVFTFNVTVEPNQAPKIKQVTDKNIVNGKPTEIQLEGLDDGDANASQTLMISATSSNPALLPDPTAEYTSGNFSGLVKLTPVSGETGTAQVKVRVQDNGGTVAGGTDTTIMVFNVTVYSDVNNPPAMKALVNASVLQDSPMQTVDLRGITDGDDDKTQGIAISATSSNPGLIPDPTISYLSGAASGDLKFTPVPGQTGKATITVTLTDNGGNENNNGNESTAYSFDVEVRVKPLAGWEDEFNDGILGPEWPATWGDPGENTHLCTEQDGYMQIQVDKTRTNNMWAGLWFNIPSELDLSKNPYISITMKTDQPPKPMLIFLWDAFDHYNTAKTVRYNVTGEFVEYFFDYSDPSFQLQGDGTKVDMSRIKALLINFDPGGSSPLFKGSFYFDDFRVGDKAHRAPVTPKVTMADIPDFAIAKNSLQQNFTITNLTNGGNSSSAVTVKATSSNRNLIPNPVVGAVVNQSATLSYTPKAGQKGNSTITVTASADGSTQIIKTFKIYVAELDTATAADVTLDFSTRYQEIDGFGAFMGSGGADADTIISLAEDIGMSMARFGVIGGGFEEVNDNSDPKILNLDGYNPSALSISNMQRIAPFTDKFIVTFWSPAGWMKLNKWEGGVESWATDNKLDPKYYEEYAEEVIAMIKIVKRETGKDIYGVGLQNEPQFNEPYPSCQVDPNEYRDMIKVVGARLDAEGLGNVRLFWAEALPAQGAIQTYINAVKNDPVARNYADVVAIHNYDADGASVGGAGCDYWNNIYNWAQTGDTKYKTWMTETSGHADTWDGAMTLAGNIFNALDCGNASAWAFWSFSVSEGSPEFGLVVSNRPTSRYYVSKQYYKFIRPGAVRIGASSAGIPAIAFKDDQAKTVSVVLLNNTTQPQAIEIKGKGIPSYWDSYTTSNSRNCEKGATVGPDGLIILPPSSVTTLMADNSNPAPTIDSVGDISIDKNSGAQIINLSGISDGEGFAQHLTILASSDNKTLIPDPTVDYLNGQPDGTLSFIPAADMIGTATITLTITDNGTPTGIAMEQFTITINAGTGIEPIDEDEISIFPNPAKDFINICMGNSGESTLTVTDENGKVLLNKDFSLISDYKLDVSNYSQGIYLVTVNSKNKKQTARFVVR